MKTRYFFTLLSIACIATAHTQAKEDGQILSDGQIRHLEEKRQHGQDANTAQLHLKSGREAILVQVRTLRELNKSMKKVKDERTASFQEDTIEVAIRVYQEAHAAQLKQMSKLEEKDQKRLANMEEEQLTELRAEVIEQATRIYENKGYKRDKINALLAPLFNR